MSIRFLKGHGTENDFVVLPFGEVPDELTAERVRALCDRRAGIGGDGVLRVERRNDLWFMDYRNADGSIAEMCGNGIRVFAKHLIEHEDETSPLDIDTRAGVKHVEAHADGTFTVDLGEPLFKGHSVVSANEHTWSSRHVDMGNPHAVAFVDSLDDAGPLFEAPAYDLDQYPHGVNVEFVVRCGDRHVAMRVFERGSGETRSCGTGTGAVMVAAAERDHDEPTTEPVTYRVDVPGGTLQVTWTPENHVLLNGPAVLVAEGRTDL